MKSLCPGHLAVLYLARHSGFENRCAYGDLFRALRLPEGTALQQRLNDRIRQERRRGKQPSIRVWYEDRHGAVRRAFYWMSKKDAKKVLREAKKARRCLKAAA